jgi:uncharacterized membrane protein
MPANMASHWNIKGMADNFTPKFWGLFLLPIISGMVAALLVYLPKIDPLKANVVKFNKYYQSMILLIVVFLFYLYLLSVAWNLGNQFNFNRFMAPAFAVLLFGIGYILPKTKRNWFIGIRTSWTLTSDTNWDKTHLVGGILFKFCAIVAVFGTVFPNAAIYLLLVPLLASAIYIFYYSYRISKNEK